MPCEGSFPGRTAATLLPVPADGDHLSRYCKPTAVGRDGLPTTAAFEMRENEEYLSVNWLEYFGSRDLDAAVGRVREAFRRKGFRVRPNGRFAVFGVGAAKAAVESAVGRPARIKHLPVENDESHAGLSGYTSQELSAAVELRMLVRRDNVHPGVSGS